MPRATQTTAVLIIVVAMVVGEGHAQNHSQSSPAQLAAQNIANKEFDASQVSLSLLVNQLALLKILTESSTICSLHERELQENRDLKMELDVKAEGLKNELQHYMEAAVNKLKNKTTATITEMDMKNQEAGEMLNAVKDAAVNISRQGEKELQEMRELMNDLQEFKTKATEENQNMTAMINDNKAKNEETLQALNEMKETLADLSLVVTRIPECEAGWSKYQSSCYKVFKTRVTHAAAKETCQAYGAQLATIGSEGENSFVAGLMAEYTYIGLDDIAQEGVFTWQDGSPFSYSRWLSGQPDNYGRDENCVVMSTNSYWYDVPCTGTGQFACEKRAQ